ncbi:MAG: winged helix-turn-helix transcriptional regulator, partial [Methanobacteriota archaeon]
MESRGHVWSDFSFVVSSGYRERVLTSLAPKPKVPRQLAGETDLRIGHVSRALRELSGRGLVECLTPEVRARGRLYGLTSDGAALLADLNGS